MGYLLEFVANSSQFASIDSLPGEHLVARDNGFNIVLLAVRKENQPYHGRRI